MSHFTKCALKMTNLAALKKALADMQLKITEAEQGQTVTVRGYRGDKLQANDQSQNSHQPKKRLAFISSSLIHFNLLLFPSS